MLVRSTMLDCFEFAYHTHGAVTLEVADKKHTLKCASAVGLYPAQRRY